VGINLSGQLHMSETVRLRNEDSDISPYRSRSEPLLYYDGHIQLDIPIKVDDVTVQASDAECIVCFSESCLQYYLRYLFRCENAHNVDVSIKLAAATALFVFSGTSPL